jgi:prepilin-type N-terminal cleavage/methylation domain-containing protein
MSHGGNPSGVPVARASRRAFTFVEIIATLALLAIVLPVVMSGISLCLSTASLARQQAQAASLCQGKLNELVTGNEWQHADLAGDFAPDWPDYRWTMQVGDWDGKTLWQLDLTVRWNHGGKERSLTSSTLVNAGVTP